MPRDGSYIYTQPANTSATAGEVIESAKWNAVVSDIADALNGGSGIAGLISSDAAALALLEAALFGGTESVDFASLAAAIADADLSVGGRITTYGHDALEDGGGGRYRIVAAGTGTADGFIYTDLTGSSTQAKLIVEGLLRTSQAGAVGAGDKKAELQAALRGAAALAELIVDKGVECAGGLIFDSDTHMRGAPGQWIDFTGASASGSLITNLDPNSADPDTIARRCVFDNLYVDGSNYPSATEFTLDGGTTTTITLPAGASAVDDFYNGMWVQFTDGAAVGLSAAIADYNGTTKVATLSGTLASSPASSDVCIIGTNDNFFGGAASLHDITVNGGIFCNLDAQKMVPSAAGGKAVIVDKVAQQVRMSGFRAHSMPIACFVQGTDGTFVNGEAQRTVGVSVSDYQATDCGVALMVAGINSSADPDGDSNDSMVRVSGIGFEDCGHFPWRIVGGDQQKTAPIVFAEAQNVLVSDVVGRLGSSFPASYPVDYASRCGFGLSGNVGAMIWGWGRNLKVRDYVLHGSVDAAIAVRRARALGDDAGATGAPQNCFDWDFRGLQLYGDCDYAVVIDPDASRRVASDELSGRIEITVDTINTAILDPNLAAFQDIILDVTERSSGKRIIGSAAKIIQAGNDFAELGNGTTDLTKYASYTLADDAAIAIAPPRNDGVLVISSSASLLRAIVSYRSGASPQCVNMGNAISNFAVTTGALSGTTGSDANFTISAHTNGDLYFENRRGGNVTFHLEWLTT